MLLFGCHSRFAQWIYHIGSLRPCFSVFHGAIGSTIRFMHNKNQPNLQFVIEQSTLIGSLNSPQYESKILKKIRTTKSTEEILLLVSLQEKLLPSEVSASLSTLVQHKYSSLSSACWSYYNSPNEIWIQANINRDIKSTFFPLLNSPDFHKLCNHLATLCPQLSNVELLTCLHSLLCLHFPADNWLSVKLQQYCLQKSHQFDLSELALYSSIPKMLQRSGITISSRVCSHFQEITYDELNTENLIHIAGILYNSGYFLSSRIIEAIMVKMSDFIKDEHNEIDTVLLIYCIEAFVRYSNSINSNFFEHFCHHLHKSIQNMGIHHLRKLVAALAASGYLNDDLKMLFKMRALTKLSEGFLYSTDVVSLINIFDACGWTQSTVKEMEGLLLLHVHELEALALKHLSSSKFMTICRNNNILNEFSERVSAKLGDISTSLSCLISIVNFYTRVHYSNVNFHFRLRNLLLQQIHVKQKVFHPSHLRVFYEYFLSTSKRAVHVPSVILNGIADLIHQFSFNDTTSIARTLNKLNFQQMSVSEKFTVQELKNALRNNALWRQNEICDLKQLTLLYRSLLVDHHEENDMIILASLYEKFAPTVTLETLRIFCAQLSKLTLYIPKAFCYLCDFAFQKREQLDLYSLLCLLEACAVINFLPENIHELQEHFVSKFRNVNKDLSDANSILMSIRFAHSCALMGHFPTKPLKLIFTVKFIRMLEELYADESLFQKLLELNIYTVLECPDLGVPWFHQSIPNFREFHFHAKYSEWKDIVEQCLIEVFGGPEYVKCRNISSPYHYNIDLECYLTSEGVPIAYRNMGKMKDSTDVRRLAVIILQPHHVCSNSPHLLGTTEMKTRHLGMLGYDVVTLFYKDLESLTTEEEKCTYFKKKFSLAK